MTDGQFLTMVIVAAIDRTDRGPSVIREAKKLGDAFNEPIHAVHVMTQSVFVDLEQTNVDTTGEPIQMDRIREIAAEIAAKPADALDVSVEPVGLVGNPASRVVDYASDENARYVVVSPRKRSPAGKALFGSTAQTILLNAECPVVTSLGEQE